MVAINGRDSARSLTTAIKVERIISLVFAGLETLIHGGAIWGWPSYVYVLKQDGFFSHLCHTDVGPDEGAASSNNGTYQALMDSADFKEDSQNSSPETLIVTVLDDGVLSPSGIPASNDVIGDVTSCNNQDAMIQLVYTIAMGTYLVCSCWLTNIIDRFGIRCARIFSFIGCLLSYILLAVATPETPLLLFPAMTILTSCGAGILLTVNLQVGNLFGRAKATVMSWINGCLSASVIVFYVVKVAHESGIPARYSFIFLACSTTLMLVNTIMMPKKRIPWPLPEGYRLVTCREESPSSSVDPEVSHSAESKPLKVDGDRGDVENVVDRPSPTRETKKNSHFHDIQELGETLKQERYPNFRACVFSPLFWLVVLWFGALQINIVFLFGAFNSIITRLAGGNMSIVSGYTDVFLLLQTIPLFLSQPLGLLMDRNKLKFCRKRDGSKRGPYDDLKDTCLPLAFATITSIGYSAFLVVPYLHVQYVTFTLVVIVMSVLWGYLSATTAIIFPMKIFSTLVGSIRSIGGIVTFLQFPLFRIIQNYLHNDPSYVIIALIVVDITTFSLPIYIWYFVRKQTSTGQISANKPVSV